MRIPSAVNYAFTAVLVLFIVLILAGQLLGQPMFIFVETDSMAPTLAPGDGYVAMPKAIAGEIQEGDVILFEAENVGEGGLTTHRVASVTEEGFITKGDNNPFTDQDGGEPVVTPDRVRSVAWQPGGDMVVLPRLGLVVETVSGALMAVAGPVAAVVGMEGLDARSVSIFVLGAGLLLLVVSVFTEGESVRSRLRRRTDLLENVFVVIAILTLLVIIPMNVSMLLPSGVYSIEIVSSAQPAPDPGIIEAGSSEPVTYVMQNSGQLPIMVFLEPASTGVEIADGVYRVSPRSSVESSVVIHAPEETGPHVRMVREYRYLMVLPPRVIAALHNVHPAAAIVAINLVMVGFVTVLTLATLGTGRDRTRVRDREVSRLDRLFR